MTKDVIVTLSGTQYLSADEPEEPIELITSGVYEQKDGVHEIVYEEVFEGFEEYPTLNVVRIDGNTLSVEKKGAVSVDMVFEPGKMSYSGYETPFGVIEMGIRTSALDISIGEKEIHVLAEYTLSMNGEGTADCVLKLKAVSRG
ncbi:MAG: DUF1934 domain-containing protein [Lachnospiraceae bacterium]|nr:DUF1934 domain-containing protein [Lachnospiraceae bacterium]